MEHEILVIITTTGTMSDAKKLSQDLVEKKFAACVQISQITSFYIWEGSVTEDIEFRLMIKAVPDRKEDIVNYLNTHHPYEIPEIIMTPFDSEKPYYDWCETVSV